MKAKGYFGEFGGSFVAETLLQPLRELGQAFESAKRSKPFQRELDSLLRDYAGRPTALTYCSTLSRRLGFKVYLKREDLLHTGAHKLNNALGQALLARTMKKKRLIAETGAGQHGVATAVAAARLGLKAEVYMGTVDMERQKPNVQRMRLCGAEVRPVPSGSKTLKDAINEALRDWSASFEDTHYLLGSVLGPHPFPSMVAHFQSVIGREARRQLLKTEGRLPDQVIACVGGGSNSIGVFQAFLGEPSVKLTGVEAGGHGIRSGLHAARFAGTPDAGVGVVHGTRTFVLQDAFGQIKNTHSVSAGLDYPAVGPMHARLRADGRVEYVSATDPEALKAFTLLSEAEGIIPALESAHALAHLSRLKGKLKRDAIVLVTLSGRGDKDLDTACKELNL